MSANVTVRFHKVMRVGDDFIQVRTETGKSITVTKPHDKSLKMKEPFCGEGVLTCPSHMA